jgi:hypothetical protein
VVGDWGPGSKPRRYVVCFNPEEAKRDAAARAAIIDSLRAKLQQGDKQLVGNAGYRRFLATPREGHFEIDAERIAEDARFDGFYVLRTNSKLKPLSIAIAYRQLWKVETIFRTAKSILETRPIYHQTDAAIAGHLFCSFLALLLRKELDERLAAAGVMAEWGTWSATSIGSSRSPSIREPNTSCCGHRRQVVPPVCSRPSASPSLPRQRTAAADPSVVPRRHEFPGFRFPINNFQVRGVQLQLSTQHKNVPWFPKVGMSPRITADRDWRRRHQPAHPAFSHPRPHPAPRRCRMRSGPSPCPYTSRATGHR